MQHRFVMAVIAGAFAASLHAETPATQVLVTLTVKTGIARQEVMKVLPEEVRATVRLYLAGKIQQWYSRADGKGVVFILNSKDADDARAMMAALPLAKANLADFEYMPLGPLSPLNLLLGPNTVP